MSNLFYSEESSEYLFVYGWLKSAQVRNLSARMDIPKMPSFLVGPGKVRGILYVVKDYPGLKLDNNAGWVYGELYKLENGFQMEDLDLFEHAYPTIFSNFEYERKLIDVFLDGKVFKSWLYEYAQSTDQLNTIDSGIF